MQTELLKKIIYEAKSKKIKPLTILIDFDGTCVSHEFPKIGKNIGSQKVLKKLTDAGHKLILFTMRSDGQEKMPKGKTIKEEKTDYLSQAIKWFADNDIPLYGIQTNPTQHSWTTSPKAYGDLIIDDICLGIPTTTKYKGSHICKREFVDWVAVEKLLQEKGLI